MLAVDQIDLLALDDDDLAQLRLEERKARLHALVPRTTGTLRFSDHVIGGGEAFFRLACTRGLEGIVSKRRDAHYAPGRGTAWQKTKCLLRQELVIGGFTDPEGSRAHLGALLVGEPTPEGLLYRGRVGSGIAGATSTRLAALLAPFTSNASTFADEVPRIDAECTFWVEPRVVVDIDTHGLGYERLRQPSFQGVRDDLSPEDLG